MTNLAHIRTALQLMPLVELVGDVHPPGYPDRFGNYQYTAHGRIFFACDPRAEEVHIDDIARQTSRLCRFGGATKRFMSVAEHLYIASFMVPEQFALETLLHDGAEAYINDMIRPLKMLPGLGDIYLKVEAGIERAIAERFQLTYPWPIEVKKADEALLGAEIAQNIASKEDGYLFTDRDAAESDQGAGLYFWSAELAEKMFLARYSELISKRLEKMAA